MDLNKRQFLNYLLLPLSGVFFVLSVLRRGLYNIGFFKVHDFLVPVIVVGNITVGGTGKTPIVIALANHFKQQGKKVGIVSRGYGGQLRSSNSELVDGQSDAKQVGDEPLLIARQTQALVMVNKDRPQAVKDLIDNYDVDLIISDDGLQHYAMGRSVEICVHDDIGNGFLLPAGALRERQSRLKSVDFVLTPKITPVAFIHMATGQTQPLDYFSAKVCHGVAGIGKPSKFFASLESLGVQTIQHVFDDHHAFQKQDFMFVEEYPIIMTAKDWVKCGQFMSDKMWYLQVKADLNADFLTDLEAKL